MTLSANTAPTLTGTAHTPGVGRGIDLENLVDLELDGESARPLEQLGTWIVQNAPSKRLSLAPSLSVHTSSTGRRACQADDHPERCHRARLLRAGCRYAAHRAQQAKMVLQIAAVYGQGG